MFNTEGKSNRNLVVIKMVLWRINYQKQYQEQYFVDHRIESTYTYTIKRGESLWHLAAKKFKVPIWLLRQHNPDVNFTRIKPGMKIIVPVINIVA